MFKALLQKISIPACLVCLAFAGSAIAQKVQDKKPVNFGYSQNPKTRSRPEQPQARETLNTGNTAEVRTAMVNTQPPPSIAAKTLEVARRANPTTVAPTEVYKVGVGDVLFINLQNAARASTYYTVLNDGTIDYPLAGQMVFVKGATVEEVEDMLRDKIKLYENPQVSVKVRDYASHTVSVLGMVERTGEKYIQREAVPLFVIKAEAVVQPKAAYAIVKRANAQTETLSLKEARSDDFLILPGDVIEFASNSRGGDGAFYFISGEVVAAGQKEFHDGVTLSQAIIASGGAKKTGIKKVVIRRKNASGFLVPTEYSLKNIKDGKSPDPVLQPGDTVEVGDN
jgi:protein involved in polysaccharide export with SLBB domain